MQRAERYSIETYNKKRDFKKTEEPRGHKARAKGDSFVVQKHDASRLHYDFRLELDGVLKSWSIPKGPSIDPDDKRLAVRTEDHPLDYGTFEGTIPKGEYGGGTVMLWDKGHWHAEEGKDPRKGMEEGHLHFALEGERMKGEWVMFRLKPRPGEKGENWMLRKVEDDFVGPGEDLVEHCMTSIATDRTMAEIAAGEDVWHSERGKKHKPGRAKRKAGKAPPRFRPPQLATLVDDVPTGSDWIHEYKYDGYRLLVATGGGAATVWTRNGKDWSDKFRTIVRAAADLPAGCLIDGEAVAIGENRKPSFQLLQSSLKGGEADIAFYAFDLLVEEGRDITKKTNPERKERLAALLKGARSPILYGDHVVGKGEALYDAICKEGGEGIISKKASAQYRGTRTRNWLKVKCSLRQEFIIIGWQESDKRRGFRSLLLATREDRKLRFAGKVGTGFDTKLLESLSETMAPLEVEKPPVEVPRSMERGAHWIKPKLVCEIAFTEFTRDGSLRHPSFLALREDKPASEVKLEKPKTLTTSEKEPEQPTAGAFGVAISNADRVIYPGEGITKGDLADYYAAIHELMLVETANRPISLVRCPQGRAKKCFFQKHDSGSFGEAVKHVPVKEKKGGTEDYLYIDDAEGLLTLIQMGTIEVHGWGSRVKPLEKPDRLVFDLDPDVGLDFGDVRDAAKRVRDLLAELGLESFAMTTGGKGLHVIVPLDASATWPRVSDFAERFARAVADDDPDHFTANIRKAAREGRIFLDWLRNQRGATAIMPYSVRAREGAPVAAPISWEEIGRVRGGNAFTIRDADKLLKRAGSERLSGWGKARQRLLKL